ncbi:hypothetical protein GN244_ATG20749 [Phytophthora infestans]|uniref:Uncharacterized protein n=1 Tax=Phytophthora infestans TaxID=4787 RepID=A0A833VTC2_PHYIN|nr:hypothetical protein GN244_ATG20749 [Phytophthora infestans]
MAVDTTIRTVQQVAAAVAEATATSAATISVGSKGTTSAGNMVTTNVGSKAMINVEGTTSVGVTTRGGDYGRSSSGHDDQPVVVVRVTASSRSTDEITAPVVTMIAAVEGGSYGGGSGHGGSGYDDRERADEGSSSLSGRHYDNRVGVDDRRGGETETEEGDRGWVVAGGRLRRRGRGGASARVWPAVGTTGSGYESIGDPVSDPRLQDEWTGRAGVRDVSAEDPDLQQEFLICRRPGLGRGGKSVQMQVNYFGVSLDSAPPEIIKYHVDVALARSCCRLKYEGKDEKEDKEDKDVEMSDVSAPPKRERRPNDRFLALCRTPTFVDVNPDGPSPTPPPPPPAAAGDAPRRPFRGPSYVRREDQDG